MATYHQVDGLVTCGLTACTQDHLRAQSSEMYMGKLYLFYIIDILACIDK